MRSTTVCLLVSMQFLDLKVFFTRNICLTNALFFIVRLTESIFHFTYKRRCIQHVVGNCADAEFGN